MEPIFSLRDVLRVTLSLKLMKDGEIAAWMQLIDQLSDAHLQSLHELLAAEHAELSAALGSLDAYLAYVRATEKRRQDWLSQAGREDQGLRHAIEGILQSKRHWTGSQIDAGFSQDETAAVFLSSLAIRDLDHLHTVVDLHDQAGEYDDEDGKMTGARESLIAVIVALEQHTWDREREEAVELSAGLPTVEALHSLSPSEAAKTLENLGRTIHRRHVELRQSNAQRNKELILNWIESPPAWFKIPWANIRLHFASACLTVNVSGTIAGLGAVAAHLLHRHFASYIAALSEGVA